jgi:hypothetical protein
VTSSHILTVVHNLIAGHKSYYFKPQWTGPAKHRTELISFLITPADMLEPVVVIVTVIGCPAIQVCELRRFIRTEGLKSWDWKKEEKESGITEETPS